MQEFTIPENIFVICLVLFLAAEVYSQNSQQQNRFQSCDAASYCIPIRRCGSLSGGWNRRGVGITCGYGTGEYRLVCCPKGNAETGTVRQTRPPIAATPQPPPSNGYTEEKQTRYTPTRNPVPLPSSEKNKVQQTRRPQTTTPVPPAKIKYKNDCGQSQGIEFILEHPEYEMTTWPWMVSIQRRNSSGVFSHWCNGFLIDKTHVLTAAHCFGDERRKNRFKARIGNDELDLAEEYGIGEIKLNELYNATTFADDIAIVTLEREVNNPGFVPVCLPDDRIASLDLIGFGTTIAGWGSETADRSISVKQLNKAPIMDHDECSRVHEEKKPSFGRQFPGVITEYILCAGQNENSIDVCYGASGAPMMILYKKQWFAVGLLSFDYYCGQPGFPTGYTRLSKYLDWLRQNIKNSQYPIPFIKLIDPR